MRIGELTIGEDCPVLDGDYVRGILILGRNSHNPVDTDGKARGRSKVTRKFNKICESEALYSKFNDTPAHIGHKYDGVYSDTDLIGSFHNIISTPKGLRGDLLCRRIGEAYHPQIVALRDNITHQRPFGGFSPLFDGESDMETGEVQTVDAICSIDLVPNPSSVKSIVESEAEETFESRHADHEKRLQDHEVRIAEYESRMGARIAEAVAEALKEAEVLAKKEVEVAVKKIAESKATGEPIPEVKLNKDQHIDPFKYIRNPAK